LCGEDFRRYVDQFLVDIEQAWPSPTGVPGVVTSLRAIRRNSLIAGLIEH
jgi:hypothetical protein